MPARATAARRSHTTRSSPREPRQDRVSLACFGGSSPTCLTERRSQPARGSANRELPTGRLRGLRLLRPCGEDVVLVGPDRAVLVAIAHLVAIAERNALRGEERAEERAHLEDLVADQLEEAPDLPLRHGAQPQAR